jgi:hypothetical protein
MKRHLFLALLLLTSFLAGCRKEPVIVDQFSKSADDYSAEVALKWISLERNMVWTTPGFTPPVAARAYAYTSLALYEAILPGLPQNKSLVQQLDAHPTLPLVQNNQEYFWPAAANAAMADMMRGMFKTANGVKIQRIDSLENALNQKFSTESTPEVLRRSVDFGKSIASAIYQWSRTDKGDEGYLRNFPASYSPPTGVGLWIQTDDNKALQPYWGENRAFRSEAVSETKMPAPLMFSTDPNSDFYKEALEVYNTVNNASAEQKEIAEFWSCDPGNSSTPAGHSFSIMAQVLEKKNSSLGFAAEAFAKLGIALNDAFICCWKDKYKFNLIRPVSFITQHIDPNWKPLLSTPPFPEYASGHSVQSAAAATILASYFGDEFLFEDHTNDVKGMKTRKFNRFSDFALEAAMSRLYGGIHFRRGMEEGIKEGNRIGKVYSAIQLR